MKCLVPAAVFGLVLVSSAVAPALSQTLGGVVGDDLKALVHGRSWAISFYGNPANPAITNTWDFRKDGSLCARPTNTRMGDKCADEGRWTVKGEMICWELTWLGKSYGFAAACSAVGRLEDERFELRKEDAPQVTFAVFKVLPRRTGG